MFRNFQRYFRFCLATFLFALLLVGMRWQGGGSVRREWLSRPLRPLARRKPARWPPADKRLFTSPYRVIWAGPATFRPYENPFS